MNSNNMDI